MSATTGPRSDLTPSGASAPALAATDAPRAGSVDSGVVVGVLIGVILAAGLGITIGVLASEGDHVGPATPGTLGVVVALEGRL